MRQGSRIINYWAEHLKGGLEPGCNYIMTLTVMQPNQAPQPGHEKIANIKKRLAMKMYLHLSSVAWASEHDLSLYVDVENGFSNAVNIFWQIFSFNESNFNCLKSWNWEMMRKPIICVDERPGEIPKWQKLGLNLSASSHQAAGCKLTAGQEREDVNYGL